MENVDSAHQKIQPLADEARWEIYKHALTKAIAAEADVIGTDPDTLTEQKSRLPALFRKQFFPDEPPAGGNEMQSATPSERALLKRVRESADVIASIVQNYFDHCYTALAEAQNGNFKEASRYKETAYKLKGIITGNDRNADVLIKKDAIPKTVQKACNEAFSIVDEAVPTKKEPSATPHTRDPSLKFLLSR